MIMLKRGEIKTGRQTIISRAGKKSDHAFSVTYTTTRKFVSYFNRRTFILISQWIAYHVLYHVRKVYVEVKHAALMNPHSKKVIDAVRGRGTIQSHGVSFYLRRISGDTK